MLHQEIPLTLVTVMAGQTVGGGLETLITGCVLIQEKGRVTAKGERSCGCIKNGRILLANRFFMPPALQSVMCAWQHEALLPARQRYDLR